MLTIVMYHYVRDVERTAFPGIRARSVAEFEGQLDYLGRHYEPVSTADVRAAATGQRPLPERACLLTFDDGLVDHRETVLPALLRRGLTGCFAASAEMVLDRRVADAQKSQFVLASEPDRAGLVERVFAEVERVAPEISPAELRERHAHPLRLDDAETMLAKRLLQDALPGAVRGPIVDALFAELVADDEQAFAGELYMSLDDLRTLAAEGMEVAGHGRTHRRFDLLDADEQRDEIADTVSFLSLVHGERPRDWTMCYPSGRRTATTLALLSEADCLLGLTDDPGLADLEDDLLQLPRFDTNDLPLSEEG